MRDGTEIANGYIHGLTSEDLVGDCLEIVRAQSLDRFNVGPRVRRLVVSQGLKVRGEASAKKEIRYMLRNLGGDAETRVKRIGKRKGCPGFGQSQGLRGHLSRADAL